MDKMLKKMFEDPSTTKSEAKLLATIAGKSFAECQREWTIEFKKEFVLDPINVILEYCFDSSIAQSNTMFVKLGVTYIDRNLFSKLKKCQGVEIEEMQIERFQQPSYVQVTISFFIDEIDQGFISNAMKKIKNM